MAGFLPEKKSLTPSVSSAGFLPPKTTSSLPPISTTPSVGSQALKPDEHWTKNFGERFLYNLNPLNSPVINTGSEEVSSPNPITQSITGAGESLKTLAKGGLTASIGGMSGTIAGDKPVNVPWVGNINPQANTPLQNVGLAANFGVTALNPLKPTSSIWGAGVRAGTQSVGQALEQKETNPLELLQKGATSAVIGAGSQYGINKIFGSPSKINKQVKNTALPSDVADEISNNPESAKLYNKYEQAAKSYIKNPDKNNSAMDDVANEVNKGISKLQSIAQGEGKIIGEIKGKEITNRSNKTVQLGSARKSFLSDLAEEGVFVNKKGKLVFNDSTMESSPSDQAVIKNIWEKIKGKKELPLGTALTNRKNLQNVLYTGNAQKTITSSERIAQNYERNLTSQIHELNPALAEADKIFTDVTRATTGVGQAVNSRNKILDKDAIGANTFNLLRKSLGAGNKQNVTILNKLQDYGEKYGIDEFKNLLTKRRIAQMADDAVSADVVARPTSFAGRALAGGKALVGGNVGQAAGEVGTGLMEVAKKSQAQANKALFKSLEGQAKRSKILGTDFQKTIQPLTNIFRFQNQPEKDKKKRAKTLK